MIFARLDRRERRSLVERAMDALESCALCPRGCGVNRLRGQRGFCGVADRPVVSAVSPHFGEEPPISGERGSGTVFFTSCTMACIFCQNYPISQLRHGNELTIDELANAFLELQARGCHNINLVTPDANLPFVVVALDVAVDEGLRIPVVANTGGYHSELAVELMCGFVDVFLPDLKYLSDELAREFSGVGDYVQAAVRSIDDMVRARGALELSNDDIASSGVLIRHLVLPNHVSNTESVLRFIVDRWPDVPVSLMLQYFPAHRALRHPRMSRKLSVEEAVAAVELFRDLGLCGYVQRYDESPAAKGPICAKEGA